MDSPSWGVDAGHINVGCGRLPPVERRAVTLNGSRSAPCIHPLDALDSRWTLARCVLSCIRSYWVLSNQTKPQESRQVCMQMPRQWDGDKSSFMLCFMTAV